MRVSQIDFLLGESQQVFIRGTESDWYPFPESARRLLLFADTSDVKGMKPTLDVRVEWRTDMDCPPVWMRDSENQWIELGQTTGESSRSSLFTLNPNDHPVGSEWRIHLKVGGTDPHFLSRIGARGW